MISVVIRTRNEERYVGFAIQSVLDHIGDTEIIVIDDNSTDDTLDVIGLFDNIRLVEIDDYTPGKALNMGADLATHDHVLFLSAHCEVAKWDRYNLHSYGAIFGQQIPVMHGKKIHLTDMWKHFDYKPRENYYSYYEDRYFMHNAFAIYHKAVLEQHPFDEYVEGKEDRLWASDVVRQGVSYLYDPSLICYHHYTPNGNTWKYSEQLRKELVKGA